MQRSFATGLAAVLLATGQQGARAQAFGPAERLEVLGQVAALSAADRDSLLTTTMPGLIASLNGQMLMRVDEVTTAISVTYAPMVVEYAYRIDPGVRFGPDVMNLQRGVLATTMCGQHDTFFILALGVTLRYVYRDDSKAGPGVIDLELGDCAASPALK